MFREKGDDKYDIYPLVVNCSAGVGRTGTFNGLEGLYAELVQNKNIAYLEIDPIELVNNLKK